MAIDKGSSKLTVEFCCDNDAFQGEFGTEVYCILHGLATRFGKGEYDGTEDIAGTLRDTNGNQLGTFNFKA